MVYDMVLLAIASVAVRMLEKITDLPGANVLGDTLLILFGVKSGSIVTPVPNIRTVSPPLSLACVLTTTLFTLFNVQINDTFVGNDPLKNRGEVIAFMGVSVCIGPLTELGTRDGVVNGMTIPFP